METEKEQDNGLVQNLKDAGCAPETVALFLQIYEDDNTREQLCVLSRHRKQLLAELHSEQVKLDCLDYLMCQIKKRQSTHEAEKKNCK